MLDEWNKAQQSLAKKREMFASIISDAPAIASPSASSMSTPSVSSLDDEEIEVSEQESHLTHVALTNDSSGLSGRKRLKRDHTPQTVVTPESQIISKVPKKSKLPKNQKSPPEGYVCVRCQASDHYVRYCQKV